LKADCEEFEAVDNLPMQCECYGKSRLSCQGFNWLLASNPSDQVEGKWIGATNYAGQGGPEGQSLAAKLSEYKRVGQLRDEADKVVDPSGSLT
jgi:hypothetical protein